MGRKRSSSRLQESIRQFVIRDSYIIAGMVSEAVMAYEVKDLKSSWKRLLKSDIFESAIHDVLATLPDKSKRK